MSLSRRAFLGATAVTVSGCAASPVVTGSPAPAPLPPEPSQEPSAAGAAAAVAALRDTLRVVGEAPVWTGQPWAVAAVAQATAHLARLTLPDPLGPLDQEPFETLSTQFAPPLDAAGADTAIDAAVDAALPALDGAAASAKDPELRLLYASAAAATVGLRNRSVAPVEGDSGPRPLQDTTLAASLPIALGHVWALIYGLGIGLGRLDGDDPLHALLAARQTRTREIRNLLRAELGQGAPEQPAAFELPTAMDTPDTIRAGWAELETAVLDSFGRLVASDGDPRWRELFLEQVPHPQSAGAQISYWPGWVA